MEEIKSVTLHYIYGRQIEVGLSEARAALNQSDFAAGEPVKVVFFERLKPLLRISREGEKYIFDEGEKQKVFENREDLKQNSYYNSLFEVYAAPSIKGSQLPE